MSESYRMDQSCLISCLHLLDLSFRNNYECEDILKAFADFQNRNPPRFLLGPLFQNMYGYEMRRKNFRHHGCEKMTRQLIRDSSWNWAPI